jgi:hypothetical protein
LPAIDPDRFREDVDRFVDQDPEPPPSTPIPPPSSAPFVIVDKGIGGVTYERRLASEPARPS